MAISRETLRPQLNKPLIAVLDSTDAREVKSPRDGSVDYFYDVNGGNARLVLAPEARAQLQRTHAAPGDTVEIVKYKDRWNVRVLSDAQEEPQPGPRIVAPSPAQRTNGMRSIPSTGGPETNGYANGYANGAAARQFAPPEAVPAVPQVHPMEELMARCFVVAAHALQRAYDEVTREGMTWDAPIWDDVRATGISLFIERSRNGAAR